MVFKLNECNSLDQDMIVSDEASVVMEDYNSPLNESPRTILESSSVFSLGLSRKPSMDSITAQAGSDLDECCDNLEGLPSLDDFVPNSGARRVGLFEQPSNYDGSSPFAPSSIEKDEYKMELSITDSSTNTIPSVIRRFYDSTSPRSSFDLNFPKNSRSSVVPAVQSPFVSQSAKVVTGALTDRFDFDAILPLSTILCPIAHSDPLDTSTGNENSPVHRNEESPRRFEQYEVHSEDIRYGPVTSRSVGDVTVAALVTADDFLGEERNAANSFANGVGTGNAVGNVDYGNGCSIVGNVLSFGFDGSGQRALGYIAGGPNSSGSIGIRCESDSSNTQSEKSNEDEEYAPKTPPPSESISSSSQSSNSDNETSFDGDTNVGEVDGYVGEIENEIVPEGVRRASAVRADAVIAALIDVQRDRQLEQADVNGSSTVGQHVTRIVSETVENNGKRARDEVSCREGAGLSSKRSKKGGEEKLKSLVAEVKETESNSSDDFQ